MKSVWKNILAALGMASCLVTPLAAQEPAAVAEIPFAFVASDRTMPAGVYTVSEHRRGGPVFRLIDSQRHSTLANFGVNTKGNPDKPSLTFACYGKECVLAKVNLPSSSMAYALPQSSIERKLHHKLGMASLVSVKLAAH